MGFLQPDVGHGCRNWKTRLNDTVKAVTVHNLRQATAAASAAADAGRRIVLLSPRDAAGTLGPAVFLSMIEAAQRAYPAVRLDSILDCGASPGFAAAALRHGHTAIRYDGPAADAIQDIAGQIGATVHRKRPPSLDLAAAEADGEAPYDACRTWLGQR